MSVFREATNYIHGDKLWSWNPVNHLKDIKIKQISTPGAGEMHFVLSIPRYKMKGNASVFSDFSKSNGKSQRYKLVVQWFLHFIYEIGLTDKENKHGDNCVVFLESVRSAEHSDFMIGDRIHFFTNRKNLGGTMGEKAQSLLTRKMKKYEDWETVLEKVQSKGNYLTHVAGVIDSTLLSCCMDTKDLFEVIGAPGCPTEVFSLYNFRIEGACPRQNDPSNYKYNGSYIFPDESLVTMRFFDEINPKYIWNKYLYSYHCMWIKEPEIQMRESNQNTATTRASENTIIYDIILEEGIGQKRIAEYLTSVGLHINRGYYNTLSGDILKKVKELAKGKYKIRKLTSVDAPLLDPTGHVEVNGIHFWFEANKKYGNASEEESLMDGYEVSPLLASIFQNQYAISAFDYISLETKYRMEGVTPLDRRGVQELMIRKFKTICCSGDAAISDPGRCIGTWLNITRPEELKKYGKSTLKYVDKSLSTFANYMYWLRQNYTVYLCVANTHQQLSLIQHARFDAYRQHGVSELHWNAIYTGESAVSKSFNFDMMMDMSIPGTVTTLTYQTTRSDAVDGDADDHITVFNEAPPGLFSSGKDDQDKAACSMMKEKTTSGRVKCKTFQMNEETKKRENRIVVSSQIGCYMGATNDDPSTAEEAMATRWHWGQFERVVSNTRSITQFQWKDTEMKKNDKLVFEKERFMFYCHDQHMKVYYVWKLIFCGIIKDVSVDTADVVLQQYQQRLKKCKPVIRIPSRTIERYKILCRIYCIVDALNQTFEFPGSKYYDKEFDISQLLDVEPLLWCTEEHAVCALNHISVEFVNPTIKKVLQAVWDMHKESGQYFEEKNMMGQNVLDHSRIMFKGYKSQIYKKIQFYIPSEVGKPSLHNIKAVLDELSNLPFKGKEYLLLNDWKEQFGVNRETDRVRPPKYGDSFPQPIPHQNPKTSRAYETYQGKHIFHLCLFRFIRRHKIPDPMEECLKKLNHRYQSGKRVITGMSETDRGVISDPEYISIRELHDSQTVLKVINITKEADGVQRLLDQNMNEEYDLMRINMDLDEYGYQKRCRLLEMTEDQSFEYENVILMEQIKDSMTRHMTLPDDLKKNTNQEPTEIDFQSSDQIASRKRKLQARLEERRKRRMVQSTDSMSL